MTDATTRAEVIQELHHVYRRRGQLALEVRLGCDAMTGCGEILPVTRADILRSGDILLANPQLSPRDALHAATALNSGILTFVSTDADFDAVPGIARLDPGRA